MQGKDGSFFLVDVNADHQTLLVGHLISLFVGALLPHFGGGGQNFVRAAQRCKKNYTSVGKSSNNKGQTYQ